MKLRRVPTAPQPNPYRILENRTILDEWRQYIPWQAAGRNRKGDGDAPDGKLAAAGALAD